MVLLNNSSDAFVLSAVYRLKLLGLVQQSGVSRSHSNDNDAEVLVLPKLNRDMLNHSAVDVPTLIAAHGTDADDPLLYEFELNAISLVKMVIAVWISMNIATRSGMAPFPLNVFSTVSCNQNRALARAQSTAFSLSQVTNSHLAR